MQLLKKTVLNYLLISIVVLVIAIPAFYFALRTAMLQKVDESLVATKTTIMPRLRDAVGSRHDGHMTFNEYDIAFEKDSAAKHGDSIYNRDRPGMLSMENAPSRLLDTRMAINQEVYSVRISTSMVDRIALLKRIVWLLAILLLVLLGGLLAVNRMLNRKVWTPFYDTLKKLKGFRVEQNNQLQLDHSDITEFNDLNKAILLLTERNQTAYASQKEFAENASHEMQSPLAVFQSKLELLMQTKPLNEEQAILISDLADASNRLARLNKSLILLTRIDNDQFLEKEKISIRKAILATVTQFAFQIEQKHITIVQTGEDFYVSANPALTDILVSNLMSNAIRHNIDHGSIFIALDKMNFSIANTGKPLRLDDSKIFTRFHKDSTDPSSVGLGLEIVRKITDLNHYTLRYSFENDLHNFSIGMDDGKALPS